MINNINIAYQKNLLVSHIIYIIIKLSLMKVTTHKIIIYIKVSIIIYAILNWIVIKPLIKDVRIS